ncbi:MAG: hypothetical protein II738_04395 [Clostridia bacterium]|nr:hypothetical protein [Clostridia bacterium]
MKKIKGSSGAIKMKYLLFSFVIAVLATLPLRVYQLLVLIDPTTGFYSSTDATVAALSAALVIFCLLFLVLSYISKEIPSPKLPTGKNPLLGVTSLLMAVALMADVIAVEREVVPSHQATTAMFFRLLRENLSGSLGVFTVLQVVFAIFAVLYFCVFAISHLNGRGSYREFKLLALSPLCWAMMKLILRLTRAISFLSMSELLLEIFFYAFLMLFLLTFARISSGVYTVNSMWGIYGYGFCAALLAALVTVPRLVILAIRAPGPVSGHPFSAADLAALVFVVSYVLAALGVGFKHGLKNRRTVNEVALPDDAAVVTKKADEEPAAETNDEPPAFDEVTETGSADLGAAELDAVEAPADESFVVEAQTVELADESVEESVTEIADEEVKTLFDEPAEPVAPLLAASADETEETEMTDEPQFDEQAEESEKPIAPAAEPTAEMSAEEFESFAERAGENDFDDPVEEDDEPAETPRRKRRGLFARKKETETVDETLNPISLADLKKQNKE